MISRLSGSKKGFLTCKSLINFCLEFRTQYKNYDKLYLLDSQMKLSKYLRRLISVLWITDLIYSSYV